MIKGVIFDFNRTLYNPDTNTLEPSAIDTLATLKTKGYQLALISKETTKERKEQITRLGLEHYFNNIQIITGEKNESHLRRCQQAFKHTPEELMVVGDRVKIEIYLANKCGMKSVWYRSGKFATETPTQEMEKPEHIITRLDELSEYL